MNKALVRCAKNTVLYMYTWSAQRKMQGNKTICKNDGLKSSKCGLKKQGDKSKNLSDLQMKENRKKMQ